MAGAVGFEPTTRCSGGIRSTNWSYAPITINNARDIGIEPILQGFGDPPTHQLS